MTMTVTRSARTGVKAALATAGVVGLLSTGVAFAAGGHSPLADLAGSDASTHATDPSHPAHPTHPAHPSKPTDGASHVAGPNEHAYQGLCTAYAAGNKADHGRALESPAFAALVTAAGGADNVAAFCETVASSAPTTEAADPAEAEDPTEAADPTHPAHPTHPVHPSKPTQAATPTKPTQAATPTHPTHPTHPSHPGSTE
jgi:hypothetical protein